MSGEPTVHVAGLTIESPDGRVIQRCAVCGLKLCDSKGAVAPVGPNGTAPEYPTWPTAHLVEVTPGNPTAYHLLPETKVLPENNCFPLVED